jgi:hypothetical protein
MFFVKKIAKLENDKSELDLCLFNSVVAQPIKKARTRTSLDKTFRTQRQTLEHIVYGFGRETTIRNFLAVRLQRSLASK